MEQPLRSRSSVSLAISDGTSALGAVAARDQYVLLRVPDCSTRLIVKEGPESAAAPHHKVNLETLLLMLRSLASRWRRPRTLLTGALALGLIAVVFALVAGNRKDNSRHADGVRNDGPRARQADGGATALTCDVRSAANTAGTLDEAPPFHPAEAGRANQPGRVESSSSVTINPTTGPNPQARRNAAPIGRLQNRIDPVPSQY
ncbi:MAG TPA: hypothetical protein VHD36_01465 [Pirellulales bacterium]|nr:hypothetical protein [Pirellulales bacterium]